MQPRYPQTRGRLRPRLDVDLLARAAGELKLGTKSRDMKDGVRHIAMLSKATDLLALFDRIDERSGRLGKTHYLRDDRRLSSR